MKRGVTALAALILATAGCSRLGFQPRSSGSTDGSHDPDIGELSDGDLTPDASAESAVTPTCWDNLQNGDETGVDCGGTQCPICVDPQLDRDWRLTQAPPPSRLVGAKMTYHGQRGTVLLYGGIDHNGTVVAGMWEYEEASWRKLCDPCMPGALVYDFTFHYDSAREVLLLYDSDDAVMWEWNETDWTTKSVLGTAPSARINVFSAFDDTRGRLVVFGGQEGYLRVFDDLYEYDGTRWHGPMIPEQRPSARRNGNAGATFVRHQAIDAALRDTFVIYGGAQAPTGAADLKDVVDDAWAWDGSAWTQICASCTGQARDSAGLAFDETTGRLVLVGGWSGDGEIAGTWEFEAPTGWRLASSRPSARDSHSVAYDRHEGLIVLFGGNGGLCIGSGVSPYDKNCGDTFEYQTQ